MIHRSLGLKFYASNLYIKNASELSQLNQRCYVACLCRVCMLWPKFVAKSSQSEILKSPRESVDQRISIQSCWDLCLAYIHIQCGSTAFLCREGCVLHVGGITCEPFRHCVLLSLSVSLALQYVSSSDPKHKEFHWLSRNISQFIKWKRITEHHSPFTLNGKSLNAATVRVSLEQSADWNRES